MKQSYAEQMFYEAFDAWPEEGLYPRSQIKLLVVLDERLPNIFESHGVTIDGFSWRYDSPYGVFTLRVTYKNKPYVVITSGRQPSLCLQQQLLLLEQGSLTLKADKYRGNLTREIQVVQ